MLGRRRGQSPHHEPVAAIAAALVWNTPLPEEASFEHLLAAVSEIYGRRVVFAETDDPLRATTGISFEAKTFTGIIVAAQDSDYYNFLSRLHELCHLIVRSAPATWFPPGTTRPRQPDPESRMFLRLCPRNSSESSDAESVREELIVEEMARMFARRFTTYADTTEEEHFG